MTDIDADDIRRALSRETAALLQSLEVFDRIDSTNSYLLNSPPPPPGHTRVAIADFQSSGRGRHAKTWVSPPGAGLCLSIAYTFRRAPGELTGLTLAMGVGIASAFCELGIDDVTLKWPNDLVARNRKLGGMLSEVKHHGTGQVSVVTGIGINVRLPDELAAIAASQWSHSPIDLATLTGNTPDRSSLAAAIVDELAASSALFETHGFGAFQVAWQQRDWLHGREINVDVADGRINGLAAGVDNDGALLVDTDEGRERVVSGSIVMAAG